MDREKLLFFLSIPLALLLIGSLWMQMQTMQPSLSNPAIPQTPAQEISPPQAAPAPETNPEPAKPQETEWPDLPQRDPFLWPEPLREALQKSVSSGQPADPENPQLPPMTLQGVFWGIEIPRAIINNEIVTTGDTIEGARVTKISKEGVVLEYNGTETTLKVPSPIQDKKERRGNQGE